MDISAIFATYKRSAILKHTLKSLCSLSSGKNNREFLVVDNPWNDAAKSIVARPSFIKQAFRFRLDHAQRENHKGVDLLFETPRYFFRKAIMSKFSCLTPIRPAAGYIADLEYRYYCGLIFQARQKSGKA